MELGDHRRSCVDSFSIEAILPSGGSESPKHPPPAETVRYPQSHITTMVPPPKPDPGRTRPLSFQPRNGNRLSLSFPIQPAESSSPVRQNPISSTPLTGSIPLSPDPAATSSPEDSSGFLVALAVQERRVLELKEELLRAEGHLKTLKRKWAVHEANKKRAEIKHVEQLLPLQVTHTPDTMIARNDDHDAIRSRSAELDRRKAILEGVKKDSRRRVMTGGHTRTLSLLSPIGPTNQHSTYYAGSETGSEHSEANSGLPRSTTMPDTSQGLTKVNSSRARHSYQGSSTTGVKQIAEDLKAGLWTFMEDLRQATVGEEAAQDLSNTLDVMPNRVGTKLSAESLRGSDYARNQSARISKPNSKSRDSTRSANALGADLTIMNAAGPLGPLSKAHKADIAAPTVSDDDWSNWDSPISKGDSRWSGSTAPTADEADFTENLSPLVKDNSLNTPTRPDDIPWPALNSFTPSNLKRTASAIMKEWEKSLTPLPEDRKGSMSSDSSPVKNIDGDTESRLCLSNLP